MSADHPDQRIVVVRHAETEWTVSGRHTGSTDVPLIEAGRRSVRRIADRLVGRHFDRVLTSPLIRAVETCRIAGFGEVAETRDELIEWEYGDYEGLTTRQIRERHPDWELWHHGAPGGESPDDVARRVDRLVEELGDVCASGHDVLVFGHGHLSRALAVRWVGLPVESGRLLRLGTASISTLGWKREIQVIEVWNDRAHLTASD